MIKSKKFAPRRWLLSAGVALAVAAAVPGANVAKAADPIKIGFSMALTGGLAGAGKAALIAMEIWLDDINKAGGLFWSRFTTKRA